MKTELIRKKKIKNEKGKIKIYKDLKRNRSTEY